MTKLARWRALAIALLVLIAAGGAAGLVLVLGAYDVAATRQHTAPVFWLLDVASRNSIAVRARVVGTPPPATPETLALGHRVYATHCVQCHGAPGVAPEPFALGLTPAAENLVLKARQRRPEELYWTVRYGLKMTGMPAWAFRLDDASLWAVTLFLREFAQWTPADWRARTARLALPATPRDEAPMRAPDAGRGRLALHQYACGTCHEIPGIVGADNAVGPSLEGLASRGYLAGVLPNTGDNLAAWLRDPPALVPGTAMPALGVTERDARDMVAYLATLK
jgi:mono/diheme cytochrome c family protein